MLQASNAHPYSGLPRRHRRRNHPTRTPARHTPRTGLHMTVRTLNDADDAASETASATTASATDGETRQSTREELGRFADQGGFALNPETNPWLEAAETLTGPEDARAASTVLAELRSRDTRAVGKAANAIADKAGLRIPDTLGGLTTLLDLLQRVHATAATLRTEVYEHDLPQLAAATGTSTYRKDQGIKLGWNRRRVLRGQARALTPAGTRAPGRAELHAALVAAAAAHRDWKALAADVAGSSRPSVPVDGALLTETANVVDSLADAVRSLARLLPERALDSLPLGELADLVDRLAADEGTLYRLSTLRQLRLELAEQGLTELLEELTERQADKDAALAAYDRHQTARAALAAGPRQATDEVVGSAVETAAEAETEAEVAAEEPAAEVEPVAEAVAETEVEAAAEEPAAEVTAEVAAEPVAVEEPEAEAEPVVETVAEAEVEPEAEAEPVVETVAEAEVEPEAEAEPVAVEEPEAEVEVVAEAEPAGEDVAEAEAEVAAEVEAETEPVAEVAADVVAEEPAAEAAAEVVAEPVAEVVAEVTADVVVEVVAEAEAAAEVEAEPVAVEEPEAEAEVVAEVEPVAEAVAEVEAEPVAVEEPEAEAEVAVEAEVEPVVEAAAEVEPGPVVAAEVEAESVAEVEAVVEPAVEAVAEAEVEPEPVVEQSVVEAEPVAEPVAETAVEPAPEVVAETVAEVVSESGPVKPELTPGKPITGYSAEELVALVAWFDADGTERSDDELLRAAMKELGFARLGPRIKEALGAAVASVRG
ncbi:hypothetical protein [Kitasatospora sp. NPDC059673]|uniref:hypothetical protein n=1 Tax=Kitasatospora sp. NPDC059673 TaxID=3346901 RepID=UPI0036B33393